MRTSALQLIVLYSANRGTSRCQEGLWCMELVNWPVFHFITVKCSVVFGNVIVYSDLIQNICPLEELWFQGRLIYNFVYSDTETDRSGRTRENTNFLSAQKCKWELNLTNFVQWELLQTPSIKIPSCEANGSSYGHEISHSLWNPKVSYPA
jgi:hypothetical protein